MEEMGPKANANRSFICRCQHQELCGGVASCLLRAGVWGKHTDSFGALLLSLLNSVLSPTPLCPSLHRGNFRLPLLPRTLHWQYQQSQEEFHTTELPTVMEMVYVFSVQYGNHNHM